MQFIRTGSWETAAKVIADKLNELLPQNKILWLFSGGSNLKVTVNIMQSLPDQLTKNLSIMPVDERYGEPGHKDSNWQQLIEAGIDFKQSTQLPALMQNLDFKQNTDYYDQLAKGAFDKNHTPVLQLGMGDDGHVAGILPNSPACQVFDKYVTSYETPEYKRMTLTLKALKGAAYTYAVVYGDNKLPTLKVLQSELLPITQQPAQILKEMNEVYVFNDHIGDTNA